MENLETIPTNTEPVPDQPKLSETAILAAATNSPALANDQFTFGGRVFKVLDLDYDSYIDFTAMLTPLFKGVAASLAAKAGRQLPAGFSGNEEVLNDPVSYLMKFAKKDLPEMAALVCNMQAVVEYKPQNKVDVAWIKSNAKSPFEVAAIVFKQINQNSMISAFADFFAQALPLMSLFSQQPN